MNTEPSAPSCEHSTNWNLCMTCRPGLADDNTTISKETARRNIAEWLYTHDGGYSNKLDWRVEFLEMIAWNFKHLE